MKIYQSILFENLTKQLAESIKKSQHSIFQSEYIVGANVVSKTYLKEQLAQHNGIAANLKFVSWDSLLQTVFRILRPTNLELDAVRPISVTQFLYDALSDEGFVKAFPEISHYYQGNRKKQYGLATKVSGLFSNYLKFCPTLFEQWKKEVVETDCFEERWQQALWLKYQNYLADNSLYDTFGMLQIISSEIESESPNLSLLSKYIPSIHFLKNEKTTHFELSFLARIAPFCAVFIYDFGIYLNEKVSKGALNVLWSKSMGIRDSSYPVETFNDIACGKEQTDLHALQSNLLRNEQVSFKGDCSVQIQGHYTVFREVEGLLNSLIVTYKATDFAARGIIVYCNDIEKYIPAIHYFFNLPQYAIPYRVLGEYDYRTDTCLHALSSLLRYDSNVMDPEQLLTLLQYPSLSSKFGITDTALLRDWIRQANIRFQYEGDKSIELHYVSWANGLDRLLYGSCTGVEDWYDEDVLMIDVAEAETMDLLISFRYFVENLYKFLSEANRDRTIIQWIGFTIEFIEFFFDVEKEEDLKSLTASLYSFNTNNKQEETFETWLTMLFSVLESNAQPVSPKNGGITFIELKSAQVLPAQFTAILGLNYDSYPSAYKVVDFDLLKDREEYINKSAKEQNKFTLLGAIVQTSGVLLLSYQSHDPLSNDSKPASVLVEQLLDYMNSESSNSMEVVHHPLQRYNTRYNKGGNLLSYTQNKHYALSFKDDIVYSEATELALEVKVSINRLCSFFTDSFKHFYNYNLGIYIQEQDEVLASAEDLVVEGMNGWSIRDYLFGNFVHWNKASSESKKEHLKRLKANGIVPLNQLGELAIGKSFSNYAALYDRYFEIIGDEPPQDTVFQYEVVVDKTKYIIEGKAKLVKDCCYMVCYTSNVSKKVLEWLFTSYILLKKGMCTKSYLLINEGKEAAVKEFTSDKVNAILSEGIWEELITDFHKGTTTFNPFYMLYGLKEYENEEAFYNALCEEKFASPYCQSEIYKASFRMDQSLVRRLYTNYQKISEIIKEVSNVK